MNILKRLFGIKPAVNFKELKEQGAIVIDVRTRAEFESGHVNGAVNVPLNTINNQLSKIKKKNKPVIAVCRSGSRSSMAVGILKRANIEAYNGGAWTTFQRKIS